mgnify:CR=1 FL=1
MRIDRLLSIVVILLNRRKITAKALAQRFEVSARTIYRDIESINLAGIPVISVQGAGGGYEIPENYKVSRQYLSVSDMRSILSALQGVNATLDDKQMAMIFEKISSLLPEEAKDSSTQKEQIIVFDPHGWGHDNPVAERIPALYDAIKNSKLATFRYFNSKGKASDRIVEPMTLLQKGFSWYLFGYCRLRGDFRLFKLIRMRQLEILAEPFERRRRSYRDVVSGWTGQKPVMEVTIKYASSIRHLVDEYHDPADVLEQNKDFCLAKVRFPGGDWLVSMILSYGSDMEVISPKSLRQKIRDRINEMAYTYKV